MFLESGKVPSVAMACSFRDPSSAAQVVPFPKIIHVVSDLCVAKEVLFPVW